MYIINKGAVVVTGDHDSEVFATLSDGSYFGELSLIFDQARTANVTAVQHSLLFVLFKQTFDKIMERAPEHVSPPPPPPPPLPPASRFACCLLPVRSADPLPPCFFPVHVMVSWRISRKSRESAWMLTGDGERTTPKRSGNVLTPQVACPKQARQTKRRSPRRRLRRGVLPRETTVPRRRRPTVCPYSLCDGALKETTPA